MKKIIIVMVLLMVSAGVFAESEIMNQVSEKLINYVENAEDFLTDQTPKYIEQLLTFKAMKDKTLLVVWIIINVILVFVTVFCFLYGFVKDEGFALVIGCLTILLMIMTVSITLEYYFNLKQIEIAPKVYILEYLKSLI